MATIPMQTKPNNNSYTIDDAVKVIFSKLDEAIDDLENGRVLSEEEVWKELDAI